MARQSLSPMKDLGHSSDYERAPCPSGERVGRKRKDAPMTHLKYLRKRNGYTLETLSEITSISISYLSRLESGARRLNTDLIKRLSHAFSCDPSELLQEISHESHLITPIDFSKKKREMLFPREAGLPLYCVEVDPENESIAEIKICAPAEWKQKPAELQNRSDVFAMKAGPHFKPYFSASSTLYLEPTHNLSPESTVVLLKNGRLMIQKVWSITPTTLQLCAISDIEALKSSRTSSGDKLTEVDRASLDALYKVVGYSDFDLC